LKGLLNKDKTKRFTIDQALSHPWFSTLHKDNVLDSESKNQMLTTMTKYAASNKVNKAIKIFKTKLSMNNNKVSCKYKDLFFKYDKDNNASLS